MLRIITCCLFSLIFALSAVSGDELVLIDPTEAAIGKLVPQSSRLTLVEGGIRVQTEAGGAWPGFRIEKQNWNFALCDHLAIKITNNGTQDIKLCCRLDSPEIDLSTMAGTYTHSFSVPAGQQIEGRVPFMVDLPEQLRDKLFGMRGYPGGARGQGNVGSAKSFHKDAVIGMTLFLNNPGVATDWTIHQVRAVPESGTRKSEWSRMTADEFFPMIDRFGQFKHGNWPGKIHSDAELKAEADREKKELQAQPGPENRSPYGGYTKAPKQKATGHFRTEKIDGKWWLIDPDGYLFWSHGIDCVGTGGASTPISDREFYYEGLPDRNDPVYKGCYGKGWWAPHNYYENKLPYDTFNFTQANLVRKYGPQWQELHAELVHKRFRSWGINTIANWSDRKIYQLQKTPYTATLGTGGRSIEGSGGYWGKFPDPFSKEFEERVEKNVREEAARSGEDPWCIGWFVDNEISWGAERSLAVAAITSPADQPAKLAFIEDLKKTYARIDDFNTAWGTAYPDWETLRQAKEKPNLEKAGKDLDAFHKRVCLKYFETIKNTIKKHAPNKLYLSCRFAWSNETAIRAAAVYSDVMSFNRYEKSLNRFKLPEGIDKPVLIGEFHFGALDRGMFHTGLVPVDSQQHRADAYENYVRSGLNHPNIVGTHWFQYSDQATTGRGDGENYQIGMVNICGTPYPETIRAVRKIGYELYEIRY